MLPTLAVAQNLRDKNPSVDFLYVGSTKKNERELVEAEGYKFVAISTGKLRRYFAFANVGDLFKIGWGVIQAYWIIKKFKPDVIFAKGGYVTPPVVFVGGMMGIPVVAHESDVHVGLANRLVMKWITKLAVAFPVMDVLEQTRGANGYLDKMIYTGLPVDSKLIKAQAVRPFENNKPIVLITGGSQGAAFLNQLTIGILPEIFNYANIIHYAGVWDFPSISSYYSSLDPKWEGSWIVRDFNVEEFRGYLQGADVVVSRSGSFVMELSALGKISVLVPLPDSAGNHQYHNAQFLSKNNAAIMLEQKGLTPQVLLRTLKGLLADRTLQAKLAMRIKELGMIHVGAGDRIAELILKLGEKENE